MTDTASTETSVPEAVRPIIGIENRTPQEVFDIMADRIRALAPSDAERERVIEGLRKLDNRHSWRERDEPNLLQRAIALLRTPSPLPHVETGGERERCARSGPCSDNGDGCSCSDSELAARAALRAPVEAAPAGVKVRKLEWEPADSEDDPTWEIADTAVGRYSIENGALLFLGIDHGSEEIFTITGGKAAAQADFEHRILSAIEAQP